MMDAAHILAFFGGFLILLLIVGASPLLALRDNPMVRATVILQILLALMLIVYGFAPLVPAS